MIGCEQKRFLTEVFRVTRYGKLLFLVSLFFSVPFFIEAATLGKPANYVSLNSGLVGWWTFDQGDMGPNVRDRSGQGNHADLSGQSATTSAEGKMGQGLSFDGVNDKVVFTSTNYGTTHSISFWINYRDTSDGVVIGGVNNNYGAYVSSPGLAGLLYYSANSNNVNVGHSGFVKGQWYHITIVRSGTSVSFYKNGSQIGTTQTLASNDSLSLSTLGSYSIDTFFTGMLLDDVRIYNRTLSASEIGQLYRLGATKVGVSSARSSGVIPNLVAHWTFDANDMNWSTGAVTDRSGNGNTAYVANIGTTTGIKEGRIGQAFNFNGTNSKVTANSDVFGIGELTVSAWVRPNNSGENDSGIIAGTGQTHLHMAGEERPYFDNLLGSGYSYPADKTLPYKQWTHVAVTRYKNDWSVATSSPLGLFWAFGLDETNDVLYAGSSVMLRCPISNGCESPSDWTEVWNMFASNSALAYSFVFDAVNGVMYVGAEPSIYRCAVSTGCDNSAEWTLATSTPSTTIYSVEIDTTNGVIYGAGGLGPLGGVIYRCVLSTGCDGVGEWTIAYDMGPTSATSLAFDSVNGVMYVVTNSDAVIYRCVVSTGCDTSGDWSLVYDSIEIPNFSYLGIDTSLGALYAGMGISLYYCNTSSGCDGVNDWATTSRSDVGIYTGMHVDEVRHTLYTRTGQITINDLYACSIYTGCNVDGEFSRLYASFEGAFESGTFVVPDSGHVYYGDYGRFLRCERGAACRLPYEPKMYINGRQVSLEGTAYDTPSLGSVTVIGNSAAMDSTFNGLIDDVRVYNRELTAGEVAAVYGIGASKVSTSQPVKDSLKEGLLGWWTFDGPDMRPNVRDKSGRGNHGNLIGQTATTVIEGKVGQAIRLDGVNDYVDVPSYTDFNFERTNPFSISGWVYIKDTLVSGEFYALAGRYDSALNYRGYAVLITGPDTAYNDNSIIFQLVNDSTISDQGIQIQTPANIIKPNRWYHVVATYAGSSAAGGMNVYLNAAVQDRTILGSSDAVSGTTQNTKSFRIGDDHDADNVKGYVDDVRVYNRALTQAEVTALYTMGR